MFEIKLGATNGGSVYTGSKHEQIASDNGSVAEREHASVPCLDAHHTLTLKEFGKSAVSLAVRADSFM